MKSFIYILSILFLSPNSVSAQITVGLQENYPNNQDGYVLFSPMRNNDIYLIDKCGKEVHKWHSNYLPGQSVYLLENGNLLRAGQVIDPFYIAGGKGGILELLDWDSNVLWSYDLSDYYNCMHHDFKRLPNGNILALVWSEVFMPNAIANGRDPSISSWVWTEKIIEIQPSGTNGGTIVWEWNVFDHLIQEYDNTKANYGVIADHPELIDLNFTKTDQPNWIHLNSIDYNESLDQIIVSAHKFSEVWIIDHSTTTAEASSHSGGNSNKGGDILFRWGNPLAYQHGDSIDQKLFYQHNAQWIKDGFKNEGKILLFNNGKSRPGIEYSSIDIIEPTWNDNLKEYSLSIHNTFLPDTLFWNYADPIPDNFYSYFISGVQSMKDGSYLICSGSTGRFFEIDSLKSIVWEYINPTNHLGLMSQGDNLIGNEVFRSTFYYPDYIGLSGKNLTNGIEIELNPIIHDACQTTRNNSKIYKPENLTIYPNPSLGDVYLTIPIENTTINITNTLGQKIDFDLIETAESEIKIVLNNTLEKGMYFIEVNSNSNFYTSKIILK